MGWIQLSRKCFQKLFSLQMPVTDSSAASDSQRKQQRPNNSVITGILSVQAPPQLFAVSGELKGTAQTCRSPLSSRNCIKRLRSPRAPHMALTFRQLNTFLIFFFFLSAIVLTLFLWDSIKQPSGKNWGEKLIERKTHI